MNQSLAAALILILFVSGCSDINWNWSDNRKRITPGLSDDVEIDPAIWNEVAFTVWQAMKLKHDQAEIDKIIADPNLP